MLGSEAGAQADPDRLRRGSYIALKMTEVERFEMSPHPVEFDMYYSG
ncbi:hypothetical protein ACQR1I_30950 [Bradyrhizobium sp. HKCCYLS2038]